MSVRATVRTFALPLGVLSGLFALVQVFISVYSARASGPALRSLHEIFGGVSLVEILQGTAPSIVSNPFFLLGDLAGVMFITYAAAFVTGCICLGLCWYAGRQTAFVLGSHTAGGRAGFQVMFVSSLIWVTASVFATFFGGADGTLTGVFTSAFVGGDVKTELVALLVQELIAVLFGFGVGALAGKFGEWSARTVPVRVVAPPPQFMMMPYPPYPGMPLAGPQAAPPTMPNWPQYPPPPNYYQPYPAPPTRPLEGGTPQPTPPPAPENTNGL